jgi:hypothetical protein
VAWGRRPQAAEVIAAPADLDPGWDAIVIGEYERAFYGNQYAMVAPLLQHYDVQATCFRRVPPSTCGGPMQQGNGNWLRARSRSYGHQSMGPSLVVFRH